MPELEKTTLPVEDTSDEPTQEELLDDLKREDLEKQGLLPPPWKTFPFWLSLLASIAAFTVASGLPQDNIIVKIAGGVAFALYYLGYNQTTLFLRNRYSTGSNKPAPYRTGSFWTDIATTSLGYALGSGLAHESLIMQTSALITMVLGQLGLETTVWIRRKKMVDPANLIPKARVPNTENKK